MVLSRFLDRFQVDIRRMEFVLSTTAYCKMVLHALKYPHCAVNGLLVGEKVKGAGGNSVAVLDAVPLFHRWHGLTPMLEIALSQVDLFCQQNKKGCAIVGYYQANERLKDVAPDSVAFKVVEKIQASFNDAVCVMLDNSQFAIDCEQPCYRVFSIHEQKWKQKDSQKFYLEEEEKALASASACIQTKLCREIVDFDNHFDDVSLDFWNCSLNDKIKRIN